MDFIELSKSRYSVRSFSSKKVEEEKLKAILEAGNAAPTACNIQPQRIYVLNTEESIEKLKKVSKFVFGASTVLIITSDDSAVWKNPFSDKYHTGDIDCSIVCTHIMMQAWELGIGSCWIGYFDPDLVAKEFNLPQNERVIAILPIGYPAEDAKPSSWHFKRKPLEETVKYL